MIGGLVQARGSCSSNDWWRRRGQPCLVKCRLLDRFHFSSILYYSILFYSILFYSIIFYSILFYSILFYSILFYSVLFYSILFYSILFYSILFYSILFYSILFYSIKSMLSLTVQLCSCWSIDTTERVIQHQI